ncbi:DMT family transporter [Ideonella azotifigens]|uniref:EamA family transporter n=1 Tax=Ideonella azotifigens TaxID=513160 RepID=A0ABN1KL58_9BURK|nr:EamA family transporter [Ideonella azotifigens]MCD2344779.1 DMT family transporter [Ideonella azotifigens]
MSGGTPGSGWVLLAVLGAALLHASWNALIKSSTDKALDTGLIHGLGTLVAPPLMLWLGLPDASAWPYILASTAIHIGYYIALAGAYKHGDLGLTYPLMRGCAPLLVALCSHALISESLSFMGWAGVLTICTGVLALGLSRHANEGDPARRRKALRFALLNAVFIAGYTLVDGVGVRVSGDAGRYVAALFLLDGLPYLSLVLWQRRAQWPATRAYMTARWPVALGGTVASLGSYGIALWAMTLLPVAMVAAMRETSVLFAALIGTLLLREPFGWQRAGGTAVIVAGIIVLRLH